MLHFVHGKPDWTLPWDLHTWFVSLPGVFLFQVIIIQLIPSSHIHLGKNDLIPSLMFSQQFICIRAPDYALNYVPARLPYLISFMMGRIGSLKFSTFTGSFWSIYKYVIFTNPEKKKKILSWFFALFYFMAKLLERNVQTHYLKYLSSHFIFSLTCLNWTFSPMILLLLLFLSRSLMIPIF